MLRGGVLSSSLLLAVGAGLTLASPGEDVGLAPAAAGGESLFRWVVDCANELVARGPSADLFTRSGIVVLLLTPYARVLASLVYFAADRDRTYTLLTAFVLGVLTYSLASH